MGLHDLYLIVLWLAGAQGKLLGRTRHGLTDQNSHGQGPLQHQAVVQMQPSHPSLLWVSNCLFCAVVPGLQRAQKAPVFAPEGLSPWMYRAERRLPTTRIPLGPCMPPQPLKCPRDFLCRWAGSLCPKVQ